jgi:hypothetical protein
VSHVEPSLAASTWAGARRPLLPWLLVPAVIFAVAAHALVFQAQADWRVFYRAGHSVLAGEALYRPEDLPWVYKYAPVTAYLFVPFALLPPGLARVLWVLLNAAAVVRGYALAASLVPRPLPRWAHALVLGLSVASVKHLFLYGNCDGLLLWLALESEALRRTRPLLSGMLLALVSLFKPPLALLPLAALLARQWRRIAGVVLGALALGLLPVVLAGPARAWAEVEAWRRILSESTGPMVCSFQNQGVFAFACAFVAPQAGTAYTLVVAGLGLGLVVVLGLLVRAVARLDAERGRVAFGAVVFYCAAVLSPLGWRQNLVMLVPLLYLLVEAGLVLRSRALFAAALVVPALASLAGLLAYEVLSNQGFQRFLGLRPFGLAAVVTAVSALALQRRAAALAPWSGSD